MHQHYLPGACQRWSSPVQLTVVLGMLAIIGSMLAALASRGRPQLNWSTTVSLPAGNECATARSNRHREDCRLLCGMAASTLHVVLAEGAALQAACCACHVAVALPNLRHSQHASDASQARTGILQCAAGGGATHSCCKIQSQPRGTTFRQQAACWQRWLVMSPPTAAPTQQSPSSTSATRQKEVRLCSMQGAKGGQRSLPILSDWMSALCMCRADGSAVDNAN